MLALPKARRWSLDDDDDIRKAAADSDANGFVKHAPEETLVIDEVQKAPRFLNAIKMVVDRDDSRGQYLLTGSANIRFAKMVGDSLAGRLGVVRLRQLAFAEMDGNGPDFLDAAFKREFEGRDFTGLGKRDVLRLAFMGGSTFGVGGFKHLKWFAANLTGKRPFTGVVLHSGEHTLRFGEGFYAVPLAALGA